MDDLARYIVNYYSHLMTENERSAHKSLLGLLKASNAESPEMKKALADRWISKDPRVLELLTDGPDATMARVRDRVMRECPENVYLNNCPRCGALAKTPTARQCPKCFFSWHDDA